MDLEQKAIERLKMGAEISQEYYHKPLLITYSGGKDSDCVLELARRAGIDYEVQHSHTTADAPETVRYVRERFKRMEQGGINCTINYPVYKGQRVSMWSLIPIKLMPPTRQFRYCCHWLKETAGRNRVIATGVRWAESRSRQGRGEIETITGAKTDKTVLYDNGFKQPPLSDGLVINNDNDARRRVMEHCQIQGKITINPIIDWTDGDVWQFLHDCSCTSNPLYQCGFGRVGCLGCPLATRPIRHAELVRYPKYRGMYTGAFDRMVSARIATGKPTQWTCGQEVFDWWMQDDTESIKLDGIDDLEV